MNRRPTLRVSAILPSLSRPSPSLFSRHIHLSPPSTDLPFSIDNGLQPFLSPGSLKLLAIDWHQGLLDRLNQHVKGTELEHKSLFDTIVHLAKDRTQVIPFNLASEALNNSFFLNGLKNHQSTKTITNFINNPSKTSSLYSTIESTYGSITQFKSYFSNAAMGMSTSGYIWLTSDQDGSLGICATYGGGTLLVQNRQQRGDWPRAIAAANIGLDKAGRPRERLGGQEAAAMEGAVPQEGAGIATQEGPALGGAGQPERSAGVRMFSTSGRWAAEDGSGPARASFADSLFAPTTSPTTRLPNSSTSPLANRAITRKNTNPRERFSQLHPLLCLAVAERAYLIDHGVWGKETYVGNFWKCVDWDKVEKAFEARVPMGVGQSGIMGHRSLGGGGAGGSGQVWNS